MDAIEAARQEALKMHIAAIESGGEISSCLQFVSNEIVRRNIDVYAVSRGDAQLKGGRAVYDSQAGMIIYEDYGTEFDKAFLIAHELAHITLEGDGEDFVAEKVDATRSSEEPLVGVERVLDYGSHERREVLMDIFAREFLLPRQKLQEHYLQQDMDSAAIADLYQAPLVVVQQQLLDALLLPPYIPGNHNVINKNIKADESQNNAASHRDAPYQLQAGPGTGKTSTLVQRVFSLLDEGINPSSILILTFSNKAAGELRERIAAKAPASIATLWVGTFHAFGLDVIHRFHDFLNFSNNPTVIGRYEAIELLEDELARLPLKHYRSFSDPTLNLNDILSAISRAKDEVVNATRYYELAQDMLNVANNDDDRVSAEKCLEVASVYQKYEQLLRERDTLDFGDLVLLPAILVESNEDVRNSLSERHKHILVDEYQDVNRASVRLLKAIAGDAKRLWVVGDSRQSIYRFRGASSINMRRFLTDFPGAQATQLSVNYRSAGEVIDFYSTFSTSMKASEGVLPLNLYSYRGLSGVLPEYRIVGKPDEEIAAIAASILEKKDQGFSYEQQAILSTTHSRLSDIASVLEQKNIPILYLGSLFERSEIKDLLSLISILIDKRAQGLIRAASMPDTSMTLDDIRCICDYLKEHDLPLMGWVDHIDDINGLADTARMSLTRLSSILGDFSKEDAPWPVLASLVIDKLKVAKKIAQSESFKEKMQGIAIWQLLNFSRKKINGKGLLIDRLLSRIRRMVLLSEDRDIRQLPQAAMNMDGVRLMTIHASKGLEFGVVHLPGLVATGLPGANRPPRCLPPNSLIEGTEGLTGKAAMELGHDEEEECKFFVAASRARDRLIMYAYSQQENGNNRAPSKYIDRVTGKIQQINSPPLLAIETKSADYITTDVGDGLLITDSQLSLYDRCPRRFLYTHGLILGGKRTESAFLKMNNAIYHFIDWLKINHSASTPQPDEIEIQFQNSWFSKGPIDHAYAEDYRRIGYQLIQFLVGTRLGRQMVKPEVLNLTFPSGCISITPDEVVVDANGQHTIRRVKTGKQRSDEFDQIDYTILVRAVEQHFGKDAKVEAIHLGGETLQTVTITERKQSGRLEKTKNALAAITNGQFPMIPDSRTCPTCPSFFICGKVPLGTVNIKK